MKRCGFVLLILLILVLVGSCDFLDPSREVQFSASATSGLLTGSYLIEADSVLHHFIDEAIPWSVEIDGNKGDYVVLTVSGGGDVTASIYVDGALFEQTVGTFIVQAAGCSPSEHFGPECDFPKRQDRLRRTA